MSSVVSFVRCECTMVCSEVMVMVVLRCFFSGSMMYPWAASGLGVGVVWRQVLCVVLCCLGCVWIEARMCMEGEPLVVVGLVCGSGVCCSGGFMGCEG